MLHSQPYSVPEIMLPQWTNLAPYWRRCCRVVINTWTEGETIICYVCKIIQKCRTMWRSISRIDLLAHRNHSPATDSAPTLKERPRCKAVHRVPGKSRHSKAVQLGNGWDGTKLYFQLTHRCSWRTLQERWMRSLAGLRRGSPLANKMQVVYVKARRGLDCDPQYAAAAWYLRLWYTNS